MTATFTAQFSSIQLSVIYFNSTIDAVSLYMINSMLHLLPPMAQQPPVGQGSLIIEFLRSHSDTRIVGVTPQDE